MSFMTSFFVRYFLIIEMLLPLKQQRTTIASNKNKSCEIPKKIEVTQEDINASPIIAVNNVSDGKLIHKEDILKINALGLIDKGRVEDKKIVLYIFQGIALIIMIKPTIN